MSSSELKLFIRKTADRLGFSHVGISPASKDPIKTQQLNMWLDNDYHATMEWMEIRAAERGNIHTYFPEVKSVISLSMNYFTGNVDHNNNIGKISNYAWGDDYHNIIKPFLLQISIPRSSSHMSKVYRNVNYRRIFVNFHPIHGFSLAYRSAD